MNEKREECRLRHELTLKQSQQGVSNDVLNIRVILFSIHSDDGNPSRFNIKQLCVNILFLLICEIGYSLREWARSNVEVIRDMASELLLKFNKNEKASSKFKTLKDFVKILFIEYESTAPRTKHNEHEVHLQVIVLDLKKLLSNIARQQDDSDVITKLDNYYRENMLLTEMELDLLAWWTTNGFKYPTLERIARDILAIPISVVASKSAFSTSGRLISPHRSRLRPKTLEVLMCDQSWLLNEIRETCPDETKKDKACCRTVEYDYDEEEVIQAIVFED
ncbi:zinc finger BED domain-containing protein RICESLEEPER 2-like protein [Tanacetum coccineum]